MRLSEIVNPALAQSKLPTSVVGTQPRGQSTAQRTTAQQQLKRGQRINLPTDAGDDAEFTVDTVAGNDVTIKPVKRVPGAPEKVTFKKDQLAALNQPLK
jgi:hypothetical protein